MRDGGYIDYRAKSRKRYYGAEAEDFYSGSNVFTPKSLSNLQMWLKADSLSFNNNDPVGQWNDSSGNNHNFIQFFGGNQPLFKTNVKNNLPSVRSDGVDDYLTNDTYSHAANGSYSIFLVYKEIAAGSSGRDRVLLLNPASFLINCRHDADADIVYYDTVGFNIFGAGDNNFHYYSLILAHGGSGQVFKDGISLGSGSFTGQVIPGTNVLLFSHTGVNPSNIDLCEFFFYDRVVTVTERQKCENYLKVKYGF